MPQHRLFIALWQPNLNITSSYPMDSKWAVLEQAMREAYLQYEMKREQQKELIWHFLFVGPELFFNLEKELRSEIVKSLLNEKIAKWTEKKENCLFIPGSMKWTEGQLEKHAVFLFENGKIHQSPTITLAGLRVGIELHGEHQALQSLDVHVVLTNGSVLQNFVCHPNGVYVQNSSHPNDPRVLTFQDGYMQDATPAKLKQQAVRYVEVVPSLISEQNELSDQTSLRQSKGISNR